MRKAVSIALFLLLAIGVADGLSSCSQATGTFEAGKGTFLLNGEPMVVKAAEIHYPRIPEPYWEQRIESCKALGMNTICSTYSGTCMNKKKACSTSRATRILPSSAA